MSRQLLLVPLLVALATVALAAVGCSPSPGGRTVVLISIDTLRPGRLGVYGNTPDVSPRIDALAKQAVVFDQALANAPWTLPSHMSMLTGLVQAFREPRRGEVIVFRPPHDPEKNYVKRVVGVEGDTLEMREKLLLLNGKVLEEGYARHIDARGDAIHPGMRWQSDHLVAATPGGRYAPSRDVWGPLVVAKGQYFVLGDNRDNSEDSRYWGFVGREAVRGKPWVVYLSLEDPEDGKGVFHRVRWARFGHIID